VSFCWKLPQSPSAYTKLSFTINSIYNPTLSGATKVLSMNGTAIPIFYAFQDTSAPNTFQSTKFNSVWINANAATSPYASSATFFNYATVSRRYGSYGLASLSATLNGNNATLPVFIPAVAPNNSTYVYLRIAVQMSKEIRFGSVSATIS
jgi:hypothetical protein